MASVLKHLLNSVAPRPVHDIEPGPFDIRVLGKDDFVATTRSALDLLQANCPDYYQVVVNHVAAIETAHEGSGKHHGEPPRIPVEGTIGYGRDLPLRSRVLWYAGAILHEAWHSKLYRESRLENPEAQWPIDAGSALQREDACLQLQHDALLRMGAPQWMLDYVRSKMGLGPERVADRNW